MELPRAEIILADTLHVEAECLRIYAAPPFGSFVRVESEGLELYGVVYQIATGCIDSNRKTQALGLAPEEIPHRMPHLELVLRTTFSARVIGFRADGAFHVGLPAQPARIHCPAFPAGDAEVRGLTRSPLFLRPLATATELPVEEVVAATVRAATRAWRGTPDAETCAACWYRYLARLFRNDYDRFEAVMQRVGQDPESVGKSWEEPLPLATARRDPFEEA